MYKALVIFLAGENKLIRLSEVLSEIFLSRKNLLHRSSVKSPEKHAKPKDLSEIERNCRIIAN